MRGDSLIVFFGVLVALAFFALCGFVIWRTGRAAVGRTAAVLAALAGLLTTLPPILMALRG